MRTLLRRWLQRFPRASHLLRAFKAYLWTDPEVRHFPRLCRRDAHAIDVGAAYGGVAYWMRRQSAGVTLLEPNPDFVELLSLNFRGPDVTIVPKAVSAAGGGRTTLLIPDGHYGRATIDDENSENVSSSFDRVKRCEVDLVCLDDLTLPTIGFVKIDVEGHEVAVLQGGRRLLERDRPNLMIEIEDRHHEGSFRDSYALLRPLGYRCLCLRGRSFIEVTPETFSNVQDPEGLYLHNFIFTAHDEVFRDLVRDPVRR